MSTTLLFIVGVALLLGGAELLVRGASRLAALAGISPLVIGLTVVAFGTSAPELAVSVRAALIGETGSNVAVGNVIGSNIFNVLVILGISALITPLAVKSTLCRVEVPIMIGCSALVLVLGLGGQLSRPEGGILLVGILAYTVSSIRTGRRESGEVRQEYERAFGSTSRSVIAPALISLGGLAMLTGGAAWLVEASMAIARSLGVSELVIGVTIVAGGTSLPEVATSIVASLRGERDIAVGNVVGSNIFNLLAVLGASSLASPSGVQISQQALRVELPIMLAVAVGCLPVFLTGSRISRSEGLYFLVSYGVYLAHEISVARQGGIVSDAGPAFYGMLVFWAMLPLAPRFLRHNRQVG